jgi:hypothetical protein
MNGPVVTTVAVGEATEQSIARDLARRGVWVAPLFAAFGLAVGGTDGLVSAALAVALVCVNFVVSAALMTVTARISLGLMMGAVLFGYLVRLALIALVVYAVRDQPWLHRTAFGVTVVVTHLGLLVWETRHVSASLAFPGLKPGFTNPRTNP